MKQFVIGDDVRVNTEELVIWAKACHSARISIHAYDARYKKFLRHITEHPSVVLVYQVKDHHCIPITDVKLKIKAAKAYKGGCDNLLKHIVEVRWSKRHDKIKKLKDSDDIALFKKNSHVLILPENYKIQEAIKTYTIATNNYV